MDKGQNLLEKVIEKAKQTPQKVAFPEAEDPKMLKAIDRAVRAGICELYIVGDSQKIKQNCLENQINDQNWHYIDLGDQAYQESVLEKYLKLPNILFNEQSLRNRLSSPLYFAFMMQAVGDVDVTFAGFDSATGDVILAAQSIIGLEKDIDVISSIGIAELPNYTFADGGKLLAVGDCAVCPNPNASQLASIAIAACDTVRAVTDLEPRCALLSYSTTGSASG